MTRVALPRRAMASASLPTATKRPSLIATAVALGFSRSTVCKRPLNRIRSALMALPLEFMEWLGDRPAAAVNGKADHRAPVAPTTELLARKRRRPRSVWAWLLVPSDPQRGFSQVANRAVTLGMNR